MINVRQVYPEPKQHPKPYREINVDPTKLALRNTSADRVLVFSDRDGKKPEKKVNALLDNRLWSVKGVRELEDKKWTAFKLMVESIRTYYEAKHYQLKEITDL